MNILHKKLFIALSALGIAGAALAQTAAVQAPEGRHPHAVSTEQRAAHQAQSQAERQARRAERQARRAAKLRAELKITAQQEPAFAAFLAAGKPARHPQARAEHGKLAALPAPQRLQQHIERQKQRTARMEARLSALNSLYAALSPEQRKVFDEQKQGRRGGRHHGGHGMMRG